MPAPGLVVLLVLGLILCTRAAASSQPGWRPDVHHSAWTREDGAPSAAYSIAQDDNGLLWFAASDGLYSFDGDRFDRHDSVSGHKLRSPVTMAVAAHGGALWVSYQFGDISRFERNGARHYLGADSPPTTVFEFEHTPDGTLWARSGTGMYYLDGERWQPAGPAAGLPEGRPTALNKLSDGSMLVYFADGIYRSVAGGEAGVHRFRKVLDGQGWRGGQVQPDGRVLIGKGGRDIAMFDPVRGQLRPFRLRNGGAPMNGYYTDRSGGLWVATGTALQLLDGDAKVMREFTTAGGLSGLILHATFTDREGNVWFVTENGVDRMRQARLSTITLPPGFGPALSLAPGDGGAVWIGNTDRQKGRAFASFVLEPDGVRRTSSITSVSSSYRAPDGSLWFGNSTSLWRVRDGATRHWPLPPGLAGQNVQAMAVDADGTLWVSVIARGVHTFRDGQWRAGGGHAELAGPTAVSLAADTRGRIWIGYTGNKIAVLERGVVRHYGPQQGLAVGNTLAIVPGRDRVWIGGDLGLAWFDGARFTALDERGGRGLRGVSGIVERDNGELWLHDTGGLVRIDAAELAPALAMRRPSVIAERFDHLDGHRGMPAQMQPLPSLVRAGDGRLWYATTSSVGYIDPDRIARNPRPPTVLVSAIRTDRGSYAPGGALVLPARTTRLEIAFTATALSIPERVRFRYRLSGQERDWRESTGLRQAVYTNLAPGAYTFEVSAANEDGVWSKEPARAALRIEPAWNQTWWFRLACLLALLGAAWALHCWRLARLAAGLAQQMRVRTHERERIARTLHDTFLQSVQALVLRLHVLMGRLPPGDGMRAEMEDVLSRAEGVIDEGRARVQQLRAPSVCRGALAESLADAGRALAAGSAVCFEARCLGQPRQLKPEVEDELFAIGREALSNAFRHAKAGTVRLELDFGDTHVRLTVTDDGCGVPDEVLERGARHGHWGLTGMRESARLAGGELRIDSSVAGTSIAVCVPAAVASSFA
ncbi:ATP-binding protein [Massilia sp.]|uniref:sensor histidine kinase n=1 Tax=Massilia sp. TaxID=1882437 RepID=UPI002899506F|nr:ATP-binding protein [Massilia sp.]